MHNALDLSIVRSHFPAFAEPELCDFAHFENAGGSWPCRQTIDALTQFYTRSKLQPYGSAAPTARGGDAMDAARARWAAAMDCVADEVVFGPSTTANVYTLAQAFGEMLSEGDEIIVTNQDHEANGGAWRRMAAARGLILREWQVDPETALLDPAAFEALLSVRTKLVCLPHCSNIAGTANPVARLTAAARAAGAVSVVDGVSWAPHEIPDIPALGADVYMFSLYKVFGVHQGLMYVQAALRDRLPNQSHYFNDGSAANRLNPAGPDHAQVAASVGTLDYVDALADAHGAGALSPGDRARRISALWKMQEREVTGPLIRFLAAHPRVRMLGADSVDEARAPTVAIAPERDPATLERALAERHIICGAGHFYAHRLISACGIDPERGVLRLSMAHYTSGADVERLLTALDELL